MEWNETTCIFPTPIRGWPKCSSAFWRSATMWGRPPTTLLDYELRAEQQKSQNWKENGNQSTENKEFALETNKSIDYRAYKVDSGRARWNETKCGVLSLEKAALLSIREMFISIELAISEGMRKNELYVLIAKSNQIQSKSCEWL